MKLWYAIRKPIGVVIFTFAFWLILGVLHGLPHLFVNIITGN